MSRMADKIDRTEDARDSRRFTMSAKKRRYLKWRTTRRERNEGKRVVAANFDSRGGLGG